MASRKKPLFPTLAAEMLDTALKAIPPKTANELGAEVHAAIMSHTNAAALEIAKLIEQATGASPGPGTTLEK